MKNFLNKFKNMKEKKKRKLQALSIFENIQIGLYIYHLEDINNDRTLRLVDANPATLIHAGIEPKKIIGKRIDEISPNLRKAGFPKIYAEVIRLGKSIEIEDIEYDNNYFSIKAFVLPNNHVGVSFENITEKKYTDATIKENEEYLRTILDSQSNIVIINDDNKLIDANRAFFEFFKEYDSVDEFSKKHECICEFFESSKNSDFLVEKVGNKSWIEILKDEPKKIHKVKIMRKDREFIFSVKLEVAKYKLKTRNIVTFTDITELENNQLFLKKRVKEEVTKHRDQEEQLLQQAKLVQMGEMITNISHHWRQPLNLIGLNIQDIMDAYDYGELDRDYLKENIDQSMKALVKMSQTIENFRDYIVEKPHKEEFEISTIIRKTLDLMQPSLDSHFIEVDIDLKEKMYVFGDATKLTQSLHNVLLNSEEAFVEKKSPNRKILISLEKIDDTLSQIVISDNAGGIKEEVLNRVFEPFFTTKKIAFKTGIGLYFAKIFIEGELHGTISAKNIKNGVQFTIKLPLINR